MEIPEAIAKSEHRALILHPAGGQPVETEHRVVNRETLTERYVQIKQQLTNLLLSGAVNLDIGGPNKLLTDPVTVAIKEEGKVLPYIGLRFDCRLGVSALESPELAITGDRGFRAITAVWAHYPSEAFRRIAYEPREDESDEAKLIWGEVYDREPLSEIDLLTPAMYLADTRLTTVQGSLNCYAQALSGVEPLLASR